MQGRWLIAVGMVLALAGCDSYPRDVEGTLDRIRTEKIMRVGLVASANAPSPAVVAAYLDRLRRATGASTRIVTGSAEPLLIGLDSGSLDVVIVEIMEDSPWMTEVAVIEPLAERSIGGRKVGVSPIARNGENRWIMLLEREVRDTRGGA